MHSNPICHLSPATKMKCSFLDYIQLLMIGRAGRWTQTPSPAKIMKCSFLDYVQLLMISWAGRWTQTPSPAKIMKCSFLDYIQLLMISWAGQWTQTPSTTALQPKKWNACFWITFTYWWSARLVDGLEPHLPPISSQKNEMLICRLHSTSDDWPAGPWTQPHLQPLCSQKNEMLIFGLRSISDDRPGWLMDLNPIHHPSASKKMKCSFLDYIQLLMIGQAGRCTRTPFATSLQPQKWNAHFWITFNSWWLAGLVDGHEPCVWPLCSQKTEMLIFGLCSTSDDWLGWLMDSNLICHPSPAKRMKCLFLDYLQLLMIGQAGQWTRTPSTTSLQPKKWNAHFWITFNFWWLAGLVDGLEPCVWPLCSQKNEMLIFGLHSTSDDWPGWSMDSNPICHPSPAKKIKCSF